MEAESRNDTSSVGSMDSVCSVFRIKQVIQHPDSSNWTSLFRGLKSQAIKLRVHILQLDILNNHTQRM